MEAKTKKVLVLELTPADALKLTDITRNFEKNYLADKSPKEIEDEQRYAFYKNLKTELTSFNRNQT